MAICTIESYSKSTSLYLKEKSSAFTVSSDAIETGKLTMPPGKVSLLEMSKTTVSKKSIVTILLDFNPVSGMLKAKLLSAINQFITRKHNNNVTLCTTLVKKQI